MSALALGHPVSVLRDGVIGFVGRSPRRVPLVSTQIDVDIRSCLAVTTTTRRFRNAEEIDIEAVMTFPVGFDAVVTSLSARIDGRLLKAVAKPKEEARETYEDAMDRGKTSVLHEEVLRGLHVLSVGRLGPGKEAEIVIETVAPLSDLDGVPFLRIPTTVGQVYGTSPLMPADDLVTDPDVAHAAELTVRTDEGVPRFASGLDYADGMRIALDRAIEIVVPGMRFGTVAGRDGAGRPVRLKLHRAEGGDGALDLAVLVDRSASMNMLADEAGLTKFEAVRRGLSSAMNHLLDGDRISMWEFDDGCERIGTATGKAARDLTARLTRPGGGTELGRAITAVAASGAKDILVLTDGETFANEVSDAAKAGCRIGAVLIGEDSLDVMIGHLAAMTGGQLFYCPGADVVTPLENALGAFRKSGRGTEGSVEPGSPIRLRTEKAGVLLEAEWSDEGGKGEPDAAGRFAAALLLPLFENAARAADFAAEQGLCSHVTSLVLVDEAGETHDGLPEMRKIPLSAPRTAAVFNDPGIAYSLAPSFDAAPVRRARISSVSDRVSGLRDLSTPDFFKAGHLDRAPDRGRDPEPDWGQAANDILAGDITHVPEPIKGLIRALAAEDAVKALAAALEKPAIVVAAALVAERSRGRQAARIGRKVFWRAPGDLLAAARAACAAVA